MSMPASMIKISSSNFSYQWTLVHRFVFLPLQGAIKLDLICTLEEWTRCDDDFDIVGLCCHIDEDHPVEAKNGLSKKRKSRVSGDMQNGEVIWQIIRHKHCSFMAKIETGIFCRNPYNVTGICNRRYCPLANSRYATIRDHDGVFYLYMKTIERAHNPNQLWERVKLSTNYDKARENIGKHLMYWPELIHKVKQRLTKMYQMQIRTRKLALKTREKIMTTPRKEIKRVARREEKAEKAAVLDKSIEKELLERLKKGVYRDIYNYPLKEYNKVLDMETLETASEDEEEEHEIEYVEGYEELEEEDDIEDFGGFALNESYEDDKSVDDDEDMVAIDGKRSTKASALALRKLEKGEPGTITKKRTRVLVEVEHDDTDERQKTFH